MARSSIYKQRNRQDRRAVLESDFSKGMMHSNGVVDDGYLKSLVNFMYDKDGGKIIPRPSIHTETIVFPDMSVNLTSDFMSDSVTIKDAKECVEEGNNYSQFILGKLDDDSESLGEIWTATARPAIDSIDIETDEDYTYDVRFTVGESSFTSHKCYFYTADVSSIHNVPLEDDEYKRMKFPVGTFAYGNSYYFFGEDSDGNPGLFKTRFDAESTSKKYVFDSVTPKVPSVSEAVTYGYNMLLNDPYQFENRYAAPQLQFEGILPYEVEVEGGSHLYQTLLMTPKKNQPIDLVCYFDVLEGRKFDFVWEWRETTASDWTEIKRDTEVVISQDTKLTVDQFRPPASEIMIRISAYPYESLQGQNVEAVSDTVEKAMVVGFDFTVENYGTANAVDQEEYDLFTATGMEAWKDRLVVWGLPKDPTILFISDYNEPSYFPYPNNITVFDNPIIYAVEFMDGLAVFTTDKLYYVTLADDGNSWKTEILQSHLHIDSWDKHLIQTVRNMLYFKSGNYYYMMVPKAQSTTGELTLAPITTPITNFFDNFSVNVQDIIQNTYDYLGEYKLITYYNFLDYDDIHNIYVYSYEASVALLYVDIIYNTSDRTWKVWVYENANMLYPFRNSATSSGLLAASSLLDIVDMQPGQLISKRRFLQVFKLDKLCVRDFYVPKATEVIYDTDFAQATYYNGVLTIPDEFSDVVLEDTTLVLPFRLAERVRGTTLYLSVISDYYFGFYKSNIRKVLNEVYSNPDDYYTFKNYQYIDTGYRDDELHLKKRYRELQLQINNLDKRNMDFGMEYILDGAPRRIYYKYDVAQAIDEFDEDFGVVYIDSTPFLETDLSDLDLTNQWTLDQNLIPEVTLWKIRVAVSGKGYAPRLRLLSRNEKRFELLNINWISKMMHMR